LANGRAKLLFATVTRHGGRWWVSLNVEAANLHPAHIHPARNPRDDGGWVGVDRGLSAFAVAATSDGLEVARITQAPKPLTTGIKRQRRLAKSLSRKQKGSNSRRHAAASWGVITTTSRTCVGISCIRCPMSWSRPTTGS
jgi:putative transposase